MRFSCAALLLGLAFTAATPAAEPKKAETNLVIRNATLVDGTGKPGVKGDVHIRGDRVAAVGAVGRIDGAKELDATGLVVCPGFIDLHTHCDTGSPRIQSKAGAANKNYLMQGVTTAVTGNCGSGPVDVAAFYQAMAEGGIGTNVAHQVPHNSVRVAVMGNVNRPPTAAELQKMEALVEKGMADGAWGLATGLIYNPGTYAKTGEIVALAKVSAKHGGHYASHIRNEGAGLLTAIEEALTIGRESGCPVHISHIKASGTQAWGTSGRAVGLIEDARKKGQAVTADQYPYVASSTSLRATIVPSRYREGSEKEFIARLDDPKTGPKIKADLEEALNRGEGAKRLQIARYAPKPEWQGKNIAAIAAAAGKTPLDIVLEIERHGGAGVVNFAMNEEDVRLFMKNSWVATASDGSTHDPKASSVPHPRSYGTFPRKIGRYAVEEKVLPLEQAVRSASGLPADILRLSDRGYLKPGAFADVIVFDPQTYRDKATYDKPHQYAEGIRWLFVNGQPAIADGQFQDGVLGGRVLRHGAK